MSSCPKKMNDTSLSLPRAKFRFKRIRLFFAFRREIRVSRCPKNKNDTQCTRNYFVQKNISNFLFYYEIVFGNITSGASQYRGFVAGPTISLKIY